jgi:hypothetical protein
MILQDLSGNHTTHENKGVIDKRGEHTGSPLPEGVDLRVDPFPYP